VSAYLDHLTVFVSDLKRSREWYISCLDLKVECEAPAHHSIALQDSGGFTLFLEQHAAEECQPSCVVTFRVEDVDVAYESLMAKGLHFEHQPQKLFWGYGAELRDPDGYLIRLWDETSMRQKI
jgi:catechol 2,3-dioxygenase-like lactoylglutathione lyase family enzyme